MTWKSKKFVGVPPSPTSPVSLRKREIYNRHTLYYFDDGDAVFLVENTLFKLHSFFLKRESPVFSDMLQSDQEQGQLEEPDDEDPIRLEDVTIIAFESFVRMLYQPFFRPFEASTEQWIHVLELSTRWKTQDMRKMAIKELRSSHWDTLSPIKKVELAQANSIDPWLVPSYIQLVERIQPLTMDEATTIGMEVTLIVSQAREKARSNRKDNPRLFLMGEALAETVEETIRAVKPSSEVSRPVA